MKHKHLIVRATVCNPPRHRETIEDWMRNLVRDIDMKIMMGPFVQYCDIEGNRGYTAVTIIETSHIALHIWDEQHPPLMQLDVYTCSELDPDTVFDSIEKWDVDSLDYKYLDREGDMIVVQDTK